MVGSHLLTALGDRAVAVPRGLVTDGEPTGLADWLAAAGVGLLVNAVGAASRDWPALYQANAGLAGHLAQAAGLAGTDCVYLGSTRVFDASCERPRTEAETPDLPDAATTDTAMSEAPPAGCRDLYGASKLRGERLTLSSVAGGRGYVLRLPMVLGLRERSMDGQVATRLLARAWRGERVRAATDAFVQAVCADTVAEAVLALWRADLPCGPYHLAGTDSASLHAVISRLFVGCGLPAPEAAVCADFDRTAPGPRWQLLAPGRLAGLVQRNPWESAVDRLVQALSRARLCR